MTCDGARGVWRFNCKLGMSEGEKGGEEDGSGGEGEEEERG